MNLKKIVVLFVLAIFPFLLPAADNYKSSSVYSPGCEQAKLKKIANGAIIKISKKQHWSDNAIGFILTLDLDKMTFDDLIQKMVKEKCFKVSD